MNRTATGLAAALLASVFAFPAAAEVDLLVNVEKFKFIDLDEFVTIDKTIILAVEVDAEHDTAAESLALANVRNDGSFVDRTTEQTPGTSDFDITRSNLLANSVNDSTGGIGVNQDTGNMVNQANLISLGLTGDGDSFTDAQASVDQRNTENTVAWGPVPGSVVDAPVLPIQGIVLDAVIEDSINGNLGIVGVNQNAGNMNNQTNAVSVAVGIGGTGASAEACGGPPTVECNGPVALAEADLGQTTAGNFVTEWLTTKTATITGSVNGNAGILGVNQAVGNMSNQANVVSVSVTLQGGNGGNGGI